MLVAHTLNLPRAPRRRGELPSCDMHDPQSWPPLLSASAAGCARGHYDFVLLLHISLLDWRTICLPPGTLMGGWLRRGGGGEEAAEAGVDVVPPDRWQLYPTSVEWSPPFTMMLPLKGAGDPQAGDDVAATITAWGSWQPGLEPHRSPSVSQVLVAALGGARADQQVRRLGSCQLAPTQRALQSSQRSSLHHLLAAAVAVAGRMFC